MNTEAPPQYPNYKRVHYADMGRHVREEVSLVGLLKEKDVMELPEGKKVFVKGLDKPELIDHYVEVRGTIVDDKSITLGLGRKELAFTDFGTDFGKRP